MHEFPQKMLWNVLSRLTHLEVSLEFPDTLKSTGGLYWGVSTILSHFWLNYFYAMGKNPEKSGSQKSTCLFWDLEVSLEFPDTLKSTGGLHWGVSTIFSHFWLNYFYAMGENLKIKDLKNWQKINQHVDFDT